MRRPKCQTVRREYHPFLMGGDVYKRIPCQNKADWVGADPAWDGNLSSAVWGWQFICTECVGVFEHEQPGQPYVLYPIEVILATTQG